ncbi:MAG TPA: hypothetical protein VNV36_05205 [Pseudomonas sp.]|uniref:hypothetical protein n=1 Tax=Pseudomonas sp. TaxID=306 RepID=UPI002BFC4F2F|nr:hypothetical protein [Pseudomonas sp.]HWH86159.1 hypothetical protein [Pseudomonas sp.]
MATVIDSLIVLFGLDPSGVEKGAQEATGTLETLKSNALSIFATIGGVALFTGMIKSSFDAAIAAGELAATLGEDVEQINAMGQAVAAQGGTVEGFNDSLGNLNAAVGEMAAGFGGPGKDAFEKFGISMRDANGDMRKSSDVLLDLSDHLSKMSIGEAVAIGETMQIDPATIKMIHQGREATEGFIKAQKEKGVMSAEEIDQAKKLQESMRKTKAEIERATVPILTMIMPALSMLAEVVAVVATAVGKGFKVIGDFVEEHSTVIVVALGVAGTAFAVIYRGAILKAAAAMTILGIKTLIATWPIILMVAAIALISAAIGLLVEDFMVWMDGGESAFGGVYGAVAGFWAKIKPIFDAIGDLFGALWDLGVAAAQIVFDKIASIWNALWEPMKAPAQELFNWISEKLNVFLRMFDKVKEVAGKVKGWFGDAGEEATGFIEGLTKKVKAKTEDVKAAATGAAAKDAISPAAAAAGAGAGNKTVTVSQSVNGVTINTQATDGKGVAAAFNGATSDDLKGIVTAVDSGNFQ